jgi:DNA-3-methyladenine glycosylase
MTTSGAPTAPRFKRSSPRKKPQLRSRRLAAGEAEAAGASALASEPLPASLEVDAVPPIGRALPREFFEVDALDLAPRLLGKLLRRDDVVLRITEVAVLQKSRIFRMILIISVSSLYHLPLFGKMLSL